MIMLLSLGIRRGSTLRLLFKNVVFKAAPRSSTRSVKTSTIDWKPIKSNTTDLAKKEHQVKTKNIRYFFLSLMVAMPVISFVLGAWQVQRLDWKTKLITKCENSLSLPPIEELPPNIDPNVVADYEYRTIKIKGHYDYEQEMFLGPRKRGDDLGYLVVTPFVRANGGKPILIERGWISKDKVVPETRSEGYLLHLALPQGEIEIVAMLRVMPKRSYLQYAHEKGSRQFFIPDVEAMAEQSGSLPIYCQAMFDLADHPEWRKVKHEHDHKADKKGWFFSIKQSTEERNEEEDADYISHLHDADSTLDYQLFEFVNEGVPIGTVPKVTFKNNHLQYLVTWFALSFFSAGLLIYSLAKGKSSLAEKVIAAKRNHMKKLQ